MIRIIRRYKYTTALLAVCAAAGIWTGLSGHAYHGHESWWRLTVAGVIGGAASALCNYEARRKK